jgi:hypothetical protein
MTNEAAATALASQDAPIRRLTRADGLALLLRWAVLGILAWRLWGQRGSLRVDCGHTYRSRSCAAACSTATSGTAGHRAQALDRGFVTLRRSAAYVLTQIVRTRLRRRASRYAIKKRPGVSGLRHRPEGLTHVWTGRGVTRQLQAG